jgi:hypothetical protein
VARRTACTCAGESTIEIEGSSSSYTATTPVRRSDRRAGRARYVTSPSPALATVLRARAHCRGVRFGSAGPCAWRAIVLHVRTDIGLAETEMRARNRNVALAHKALPRQRNLCQGNSL